MNAAESLTGYPLRLRGILDPPLTRGLWLVKWLLALPHFMILFFLWIALLATTVIAWFAILFTGRYPRGLFEFNVGVQRWSWRVGFYSTTPSAPADIPRSHSRMSRTTPLGSTSNTRRNCLEDWRSSSGGC